MVSRPCPLFMIQQGLYVLVQVPATITPDTWQCDAAITYVLRRCQWHVVLCLSLRLALPVPVAVIAPLTTVTVAVLIKATTTVELGAACAVFLAKCA